MRFFVFLFLIIPSLSFAVVNGTTVTVEGTTTCNNGVTERVVAGTMTTTCGDGWSVGSLPAITGEPVLLFSDVTSAVDNGWSLAEPTKGAVVTIWGRNLGSERGSNYITVGGVNLTSGTDYAETWGEQKPVPGIQKISFWLKSSMADGATTISATIGGVTTNALPFTVRTTGDLFFVDNTLGTNGDGSYESPFNTPSSALSAMGAGDTIYFKDGTYDQDYWGGGAVIWVRDTAPAGTVSEPITFTAYPGSTPLLDIFTPFNNSNYHTGIRVDNTYYTISKLSILAYENGIVAGGDGVRVVGNRVDGANVYRSGAGSIVGRRDGVKILGNEVYGADSGNQQDHAIYLAGCMPNVGAEVAYNWVHDNDIAEGPSVVVNHQDSRCPTNVRLASHYIHSNFVDCSDHQGRGIGIYDQSWDDGVDTAGEPEPTYVYNNIVNNCGYDGQPASYQNSAHVKWYNNTFYNIGSTSISGLSVGGSRVLSADIQNNIFHKTSASGAYFGSVASTGTISNNLCYGGTDACPSGTNNVNADPLITMAATNATLTINASSPANSAGDDAVLTTVIKDYLGRIRQTVIDIGAMMVGDN